MLPFSGIRIVDLGTVWTVPLATKLFALLGAEVIKVEAPGRIDVTRFGDHADNVPSGRFWETAGRYHALNLNKKSLVLDLSKPQGREVFERLVKVSDIVVEQFSPRVMANLGYSYENLKKLKSDIILASVNAFGEEGPWRDYRAFGPGIDTLSGLVGVTGYPDGTVVTSVATFTDIMGALNVFIACCAALRLRQRTGRGQWVRLSLLESTVFCLAEPIIDYIVNGRVRVPQGNRHALWAPHGCYRCSGKDSWIAIAVTNEEQWQGFCEALENPAWTKEERFRHSFSRWQNQDELDRLVEAWTLTREHYEAMHLLQRSGVPAAAVLNAKEVLLDPHLKARELFHWVQFPQLPGMEQVGKRLHMGLPWRTMHNEEICLRASPRLGEHNIEILSGLLGFSSEEISLLYEMGVVAEEPRNVVEKAALLRPYSLELLKERGKIEDYDTDYKKILDG
jgi:benzylsuccinate CoA-transferase BbsF subunit